MLTLKTGAHQGYVLSSLLYSLFTHDCVAAHNPNTVNKFADDTTVVGPITEDDETAYRKEVRYLAVWCLEKNLSLNVSMTKELIVDYRKWGGEHAPIHIDGAQVVSFKFLMSTSLRNCHGHTNQHSHEKGTTTPLPLQEAEQIWYGSLDLQKVIQLHH
jgi:hypothetical protein